jgi:hypothetical protein
MQVLDIIVNKIIKQYIEEAEDEWIDKNFDQWAARSFSVGDRRVLLTHWVAEAWDKVHKYHQDAIIKSFKNVGLSLPTDGSKDLELSIRDLPNITVGDWTKAPEATTENPIVISDDVGDSIEIDDGFLYTAKEVEEGIKVKVEDEDEVTTNSGDESNQGFDYNEESDFDDDVDGDEDELDENME